MARKKAVISAEPAVLASVEALVRDGRYGSVSQFVREAMSEKLAKIKRARLAEQVAHYCKDADLADGDDLIASQAFPVDEDT